MRVTKDLTDLRRDWTTLGDSDPLWAVCVDPARRGRWDLAEFMASGKAEIGAAIARLDRLRLDGERATALDFGCGVGRLTAALADHYRDVTGADISPSMLRRARELNADRRNCQFVQTGDPALPEFADETFDLVYSSLVLQHIPGRLAAAYLRTFLRVLRPDGVIVLMVPERPRLTPRGIAYAAFPSSVSGWIQRRLFGYPATMRMHMLPARRIRRIVEPHGGLVAARTPHPGYGGHWHMTELVIVKAGTRL